MDVVKTLKVNLITEDDRSRDVEPPTVPVLLTAESDSNGDIDISFSGSTDTETGVAYYIIYRKSSRSEPAPIARIEHEDNKKTYTYHNEISVKNADYTYYVSAIDKAENESELSNSIQVTSTVSKKPEVVSGLSAYIVDENTIQVNWVAPGSTDEVSQPANYEISINRGSEWVVLSTQKNNSVTYKFDRDIDGYPEKDALDEYKFRVRSVSVFNLYSDYVEKSLTTTGYKTWIVEPNVSAISITVNETGLQFRNTESYSSSVYGKDFITTFTLTKGEGDDKIEKTVSQSYVFNRDTDGYPEISNLKEYTVKMNVKNVTTGITYSTTARNLNNTDLTGYKGWKPVVNRDYLSFHPYDEAIDVHNKNNYEEEVYGNVTTYFKFGEKTPFTESYRFNRGVDGYPEPTEIKSYTFTVWAVNNVSGSISDKIETTIQDNEMYDYRSYTPRLNSSSISISVNRDKIILKDSEDYSVYAMGKGFKTLYAVSSDGETYSDYAEGDYEFDKANGEYPEREDLVNYRIKYKVVNVTSSTESDESEPLYISEEEINKYGTWNIGRLTVKSETVDKTIIISVDTAKLLREYYGYTQFGIRIKRIGNTDINDSGVTFNEMLGITPDEKFYEVNSTGTFFEESDYRNGDSERFYFFTGNKYVQTLPLIGHSARLYYGNICVEEDKTQVPRVANLDQAEKVEGNICMCDGTYFMYTDSKWVTLSDYKLVPTTYTYEVYATNEKYVALRVNPDTTEITVTALPTSISDIVKSHEHYKDLYVERISAINANIGLITQGGMGDFSTLSNYWALSNLSAEESGTGTGVLKGAFRVGGDTEYIQVTPHEDGTYSIEIHAGDITLSSSGTSLKSGTYIYDDKDPNKRMKLTSEGFIIQHKTGLSWSTYEEMGKVTIDKSGNLFISNASEDDENSPKIGIYIQGAKVYHFEKDIKDQHGEDPLNINPNMSGVIETLDNLFIPDSKKGFLGEINVNLNNINGKCGFLNRENFLTLGDKFIYADGVLKDPLKDLNEYFGVSAFKFKE